MERFFKISNSIDIIHIQELLLRRYSNLDYILNLEFVEGCELIKKAIETDIEDKVWDRWLVDYRKMDKDNFTNFEDYKNKMLGINECVEISKEALLKESEDIEKKSLERKRGD